MRIDRNTPERGTSALAELIRRTFGPRPKPAPRPRVAAIPQPPALPVPKLPTVPAPPPMVRASAVSSAKAVAETHLPTGEALVELARFYSAQADAGEFAHLIPVTRPKHRSF